MTEIWVVYDEDGNMTGKTMQRGRPKTGEYMLCVHVYLHTPDGKFLVQKRSLRKESHPGEWDITVGAVLCGEDSLEGARRETMEEVGIDISNAKVKYIGRVKKKRSFADIYFAEKEFSLEDCVLQQDEVEAVRFVDSAGLLALQKNERMREESYLEVLRKALNGMKKGVS